MTMRRPAPLFDVSKSAADGIVVQPGPLMSLRPRRPFAQDTGLITDGALMPTGDHEVAERSKNYRYSTDHQVAAHKVMVGIPRIRGCGSLKCHLAT